MVMPRDLVTPPESVRRPYGLLDYVDWLPAGNQRWLAGVEWQADCSDAATIALQVCGLPVTGGFDETQERQMRGATAFQVYAEFACSPIDFVERANELATRALQRAEGWQVEYTFWTGISVDGNGTTAAVYPHLAADTEVTDTAGSQTVLLQTAAVEVLTGDAVDPKTALGLLETALGDCYGGAGLIHVPQQLITHLHGYGVLIRELRGRYRTANGNWVVAGAGYRRTGPDGTVPAADDEAWMYATSPVFGYRDADVTTFPTVSVLDRTVDTVTARASRNYVLGWSCCHFAIRARP